MTFTERGRTAAQELADSHRELARRLFADLPASEFDSLDAGLTHVVSRLRTLFAATGHH